MTDTDLFPFLDVFRSLTRVFPLRGEAHELQDVGKSYFKALRRFPLEQVKAGADQCLSKCQRFPKPAEWISHLPSARPAVEIPELSAADAREWLEAERSRYEGDPCGCSSCRFAGVEHRLLRFVPEFDAEGRDVKARMGDRVITRGHWAHGEELKRYYAAKDAFWGQFRNALPAKSMTTKTRPSFHQRLEAIYAKKPEPVQS